MPTGRKNPHSTLIPWSDCNAGIPQNLKPLMDSTWHDQGPLQRSSFRGMSLSSPWSDHWVLGWTPRLETKPSTSHSVVGCLHSWGRGWFCPFPVLFHRWSLFESVPVLLSSRELFLVASCHRQEIFDVDISLVHVVWSSICVFLFKY